MSWTVKSRTIDVTNMFDAMEWVASAIDYLDEMVKDAALGHTDVFSDENVAKMNEMIGVLRHFQSELDIIGDQIELAPGGSTSGVPSAQKFVDEYNKVVGEGQDIPEMGDF